MLAFRRLAILDLSDCASQPMVDPKTGEALVFNGEIYNYRTLRADLSRAGETFQSTGDTEVLLRTLAVQGPAEGVRRLRGMFAFALWDDSQRRLVLARDPLGIKPLYVCRNPDPSGHWSLAFASEVRAVLASGLLGKPRLNPNAVASVVWNGFVAGPETIVAGVESLWPRELRTYDGRGRKTGSEFYWSMNPFELGRPRSTPATEADVGAALQESVRLHLASDVPLGVFLSGGVDSSAVANLAQKAVEAESKDARIDTFTLAFEEAAYNEGDHAMRVAVAIGTRHHDITLTESRFLRGLERALDSLDQPTFDGLNSYYMSQAVREAGLTVALVGTGGDELFGGYTSFRYLPALRRWAGRTTWLPAGAKAAAARVVSSLAHHSRGRQKAAPVGPQTRWAKLPDMVRLRHGDLAGMYQLAYALFLPDFQRRLMRPDLGVDGSVASGLSDSFRDRLAAEIAGRSDLEAVSILEQRCFLGERLLRDSDAASMAVSLELRLPLVDADLVRTVGRLPEAQRYQPLGRKEMLRRTGLRGLDPALFERPKSGFVLPYDRWIRRGLAGQMDQVLRDPGMAAAVGLDGGTVASLWRAYQDDAPGMYWSRVWALYVLIRWCHRHGVLL